MIYATPRYAASKMSVSGSATYGAGGAFVPSSSNSAKSVLSACTEMLDHAFCPSHLVDLAWGGSERRGTAVGRAAEGGRRVSAPRDEGVLYSIRK